jgi:hypothetical protein
VITGILVVLVHEAGIPVAPLWLLALLFWPRDRALENAHSPTNF